ncbi:putative kinetoplast-associated protein KAP [Metarhizium acridum CQMa 102]|uniref:Putative kinetoplast-associated protein KAP n=1 Tax=Metarhizium acridum (strain CQMa 102) TaxID=655827 RepID=E9DXS7_METAQ|nr:putative kinetoplast-associated protein KAP [Metarhizium acridum CQMa 102]EFY91540.1 putative kinetoplast-associated protein KAP [Metarhizium acridum CQMa 102]
MPLVRRHTITIHPGGESSRSTSYHSEGESSRPEADFSGADDEGDWYDEDDEDLQPSDSASASNDHPPSRPRAAVRTTARRHRITRPHPQDYPPVPSHAPIPPPSVDPTEDFGHYGHGFHPQHGPRSGYYGGRSQHSGYQQQQGHYMGGYPGGNQMVPYGGYGPNPFTPMSNSTSGASFFGGEPRMYDMMPYQHQQPGYYPGPQYHLPAQLQQFHLTAPPPPATEAPAQAPTPPKEQPPDLEKIKLEAELAAFKAHEQKTKAAAEQLEREAQIRKEAEEAFQRRMDDMKKAQEEAQKEIQRAREEAERTARERIEAERKAEEERQKAHAEAMKRAEENARMKFEAEQKAAEERRQREKEERIRADEVAQAQLQAAVKAEAAAREAAEKRVAEEAERLKLAQEEARRKAEIETLKKIDEEREKAKKAAEAAEAAKNEQEALKKRIEEETKARVQAEMRKKMEEEAEKAKKAAEAAEATKAEQEALKKRIEEETKAALEAEIKKNEKAPIKFKDAVGRNFRFPFHLCATWQGMEDLIKQAFQQVGVLGPHVQQGRYDLTGPNGEIILPSVWDKVVQPDWSITMTMWPMDANKPPVPKMPGMDMPHMAAGRRHPHSGNPVPVPQMVPPQGRRPDMAPGVGMPPPAGWPPAGRRSGPSTGVNIINVGPTPGAQAARSGTSKPSRHHKSNQSSMLKFFAGGQTKKR